MRSRHDSFRLALVSLAVAALAAGSHAAPQKGYHKDNRFGFKLKPPRDWQQIPIQAQEEWLVAKYLCEKKYYYTEEGGWTYEHQPELMVIAFVEAVTKKEGKKVSKVEGNERITFKYDNPYKDYEDYLDRTYSGGGFYISDREESKVGDVEVTKLEIKVEKLTRGPKRITTWVYHAPGVDFAVQIEVLEDYHKKLKRTVEGALRSFKLIERTEGDLPTEAGAAGSWVAVFEMDEGTPEERRKKRQESALQIRERALAKLPEDWHSEQIGRVFVISHVDPKYGERTAEEANALLSWLDETFDFVGPEEYVRDPIIRICKDDEEEYAFRRGGGSGFYFGLEITTNLGRDDWSDFESDYVNRRILSIWFQDRDRDLYWAMPQWLQHGLQEFVGELRFKGNKPVSKADDWDRNDLRKLVREEKASTPRELMLMSASNFRSGEQVWNRWDEAGALVRFFLSDQARKKKQTKTILADYIRNLAAVTDELEKQDDDKNKKKDKPKTEEEEEEIYKKRREGWTKKERQILDETFSRTFGDWSDRDWSTLEKAYFDSID